MKEKSNEKLNKETENYLFLESYEQLPRFISYWYQIDTIRKLNPKSILEVGKGTGFVYDYLKKSKFNITSMDYNKDLNPDIVCDVIEISLENKYDLISCSEVLEHIPYEDACKVLERFSKISKYVLLCIPVGGPYFSFNFRFSGIKRIFKKELFGKGIVLRPFWKNFTKEEEHHWEAGYKNYSLKNIRKEIKKNFSIEKEFDNSFYPYHKFFLLKSKKLYENGKCEICNSDKELVIHHILPRFSNPELTFDYENLMVLCKECHIKIHSEDKYRYNLK